MIIGNFLLTLQPFVVKLIGLPRGKTHYDWQCTKEFFETFENTEIQDASLEIELELDNHGITLDAYCEIRGNVTVACDRCLEDLVIDIDTSFEESYTAQGQELDFSQDIYDYINLALPLQRVHEDDKCNQEIIKYLNNNF